jgi:hypothetical protein
MAATIGLAAAGVPVPVCLLVMVLALAASIVIDERRGVEKMNAALKHLEAEAKTPRPA